MHYMCGSKTRSRKGGGARLPRSQQSKSTGHRDMLSHLSNNILSLHLTLLVCITVESIACRYPRQRLGPRRQGFYSAVATTLEISKTCHPPFPMPNGTLAMAVVVEDACPAAQSYSQLATCVI